MKAMFKRISIGSAILVGLLVSGGNSASAGVYTDTSLLEQQVFAPFKDANGDRVMFNREYYMEPVEFPGYGLKYEQWSTNEWAKLSPDRGRAVKFEIKEYGAHGLNSLVKIETDRVSHEVDDYTGVTGQVLVHSYSQYLGAGFNAEGVELHKLMSDRKNQYWIPVQSLSPELSSTNTVAFKNQENNKFLSYRNSNTWLYVDEPTINSKTKWRLIPKQ